MSEETGVNDVADAKQHADATRVVASSSSGHRIGEKHKSESVVAPRSHRKWAPVLSAFCLVLLVVGGAAAAGYALHEKQHSNACSHKSALISNVLDVVAYNLETGSSARIPEGTWTQLSASDQRWIDEQIRSLQNSVSDPSGAKDVIMSGLLLRDGC